MKRVLDIGQCRPDHASICRLIEHQFEAQVFSANGWDDAEEQLRDTPVDLVLVNRLLDADGSDGLEIIRRLKADPQFSTVPVMLVSNHAQHQQTAVASGAEPGFGKARLQDPATIETLRKHLG
jgi:two-component system, chemotaxis family, chemotaxis protein CheY